VKGRIVSVNLSRKKHVPKTPVLEIELRPDFGVLGDAHAGPGIRQVSLLAVESIERQKQALSKSGAAGITCPQGGELLMPGGFAENLTTQGLAVSTIPIGTRLRIGDAVILEISKIGKECHQHCAIFHALGDCVMPREGVFARVIRGGIVRPDDEINIVKNSAVLTISDRSSRGEREDRSGPALAAAAEAAGFCVIARAVLPDDLGAIETKLRTLADSGQIQMVLTTGGTGVGPRDVTPEATLAVVERRVPGLAEAMRARSLAVTPHAMLSRAEAGIRGRCLIVNLPGNPKGAIECFHFIVPALEHAIRLIAGGDPDSPP